VKIANVRYGFATNSSSSHSIIVPRRDISGCGSPEESDFGWEWFHQRTPAEKRRYFHVAVKDFYASVGLCVDDAEAMAEKHFPVGEDMSEGYIDHQSSPTFPKPRLDDQSQDLLWGWIRKNIVDDNAVHIIGGNDNSYEYEIPEWSKGHDCVTVPWELDRYRGSEDVVFKMDPSGFLTTFDRKSGKKIRMPLPDGTKPTSGTFPDLMDLKITDRCIANCAHCYQDSKHDGDHAETSDVNDALFTASTLGVFEVAIGGGEPTTHPDFAEILHTARQYGIVPNFSTQDAAGVLNHLDAIKENCGAVAFSTNDVGTAREWAELAKLHMVPNPTLHYVLGLRPIRELAPFLAEFTQYDDPTIILLAWKDTGRAGPCLHPYDRWLDVVKEAEKRYNGIGVDSFLTNDVSEKAIWVKPWLYESADGKFSFYWNAVTGKVAPHSAMKATVDVRTSRDVWAEVRV